MMSAVEITMSTSVIPKRNERRRNPRYPFTADAEIVDMELEFNATAHTLDFSRGGCYVDMFNPLAEDTVVKLRLTKWQQTLETHAQVVYSSLGMGMELMFGALNAEQEAIVESWLTQLRGLQPC
jgi:PilZ domain